MTERRAYPSRKDLRDGIDLAHAALAEALRDAKEHGDTPMCAVYWCQEPGVSRDPRPTAPLAFYLLCATHAAEVAES